MNGQVETDKVDPPKGQKEGSSNLTHFKLVKFATVKTRDDFLLFALANTPNGSILRNYPNRDDVN